MNIIIKGAREHNLKNIDAQIGDGLTVVTGVSGSGKTSLVFDTLYHEARRRLYDVVSLGRPGGWRHQLAPAQVDDIQGLGPAIAIEQNVLNRNPNSTLATACGLHPFLRLLYTNYGSRACAECGTPLHMFSEDEVVERLGAFVDHGPVRVYAPLLRKTTGSHRTLLSILKNQFPLDHLRIDKSMVAGQALDPGVPHDLDVMIGEVDSTSSASQVRDLIQTTRALGSAFVLVETGTGSETLSFQPVCPECGTWFGALEPKHFRMDCPNCQGDGCGLCSGSGYHPLANGVTWQGQRLPELLQSSVDQLDKLFVDPGLPTSADRLSWEITRRINALRQVGLGYLALDRPSPTLSRGESQRVRLAISLTSRLEDMLHILDEPTIGQHPADVARFLPAFRDLPGPVVYVEHDRVAAAVADRAIDLGPGAGVEGGEVTFAGTPAELWEADTRTGRYFSQRKLVQSRVHLPPADKTITVKGASIHNLKEIDVDIPVGRLTVITGVSGSGKSTLVEHILYPSLVKKVPIGCREILGPRMKPVLVDQSPIGRNPRSNPATYTKLADIIRDLYAEISGLSTSHFSFNRPEGACQTCKGMGAIEVKMQYLYSYWVPCEDCEGQRFNPQVLEHTVQFGDDDFSIADFYKLTILEVADLLGRETRLSESKIKRAHRILDALTDVGLGYLSLGQPSPTLSGGEAQRVKLTRYLGRRVLKEQMFILDEPSTGLHPQDLNGLLVALDRLVTAGATIVVVEHNTDLIRAADWIIDLGPGAGPDGGRVLYCGEPDGIKEAKNSRTGHALRGETNGFPRAVESKVYQGISDSIRIQNASANNLKGINVDIPKGKITVVTGLSGSGKSSLVKDVIEAEAYRRYLESLSMYERQGVREGPQAPVDSISGLGVTLTVSSLQSHRWSALSHFTRRASVGRASELSHHLAVLVAELGDRNCNGCGASMVRNTQWQCERCGAVVEIASPRQFSTTHYASVCDKCTGVGVIFKPQPDKLIIHPDKPLCGGAMYSPGYWPETYLCKDTGIVQALAERYEFDPLATPWCEMSASARDAFLYGDDEPISATYRSKSTGKRAGELITREMRWEGFYGGWVKDWDVHGTYTRSVPCPSCQGTGLKSEYLAVKLAGHHVHDLNEMPLRDLLDLVESLVPTTYTESGHVETSLRVARRRLRFLCQVGLDYLHLNRPTGTLSAGEAQRIQLAGLLGSELTALTVLLDEPSRGMHPAELDALCQALLDLRDEGNTLVIVEHDLQIIRSADHIIDMGPGAGSNGGQVVAQGSVGEIIESNSWTGMWLREDRGFVQRDKATAETAIPGVGDRYNGAPKLRILGARENNLQNINVEVPLNALVGFCGVSGSGKSTLLIDTLGRALVKQTHTTSFANEPIDPGEHDEIEGVPDRVMLVDQSRRSIRSPAVYLGLTNVMLRMYAESSEGRAMGMDEKALKRPCTSCKGRGVQRIEMGFLPDSLTECETCRGTGYRPEAWDLRLRGVRLPEINGLTLDEVLELFNDHEKISRTLQIAQEVGLGYLVWKQPGYTLSGGEAQRLKIVKELRRKSRRETLYILDEPTVGQHMEDTRRLIQVLRRLVEAGNSVFLIEHHAHVLAACDFLIELGPGGGPMGGRVIASGTPAQVAAMQTATAPYLSAVLESGK